ncbi:bifunctional riboflavin kinase/FAD synthetase [Alcanivorax quisquiliarum]|uniref:Riboflavin biosynthesis protein n=1 Tax=Alcanivorax quisquiliarum TaxID=2933565 RepID=A0ABT0E9M9_9GAMM|nr:bifunctional riboflavin kinase/FAD synthetase [Alcanivorax quisquiliarum]MCK0538504.1 bifunctional riboflavin kinase/FAD synthetase [Alcanivorax quisquiliarum]
MELIRGIHNLRRQQRGCVATIGNFDGVHLGHQMILRRVQQEAQARGLTSTVMLFEPQPAEFFYPAQAPARLMSLRDKLCTLAAMGVDQVFCARFDARLSSQLAADFVRDLLVDGLNVQHLVIGDDFRFGSGREGDFDYLQQAGAEYGFGVEDSPTCEYQGERVSSTRVRAALAAGNLTQAEALLGRPYRISGRVHHGDKLGRTIDVPTANLPLRQLHVPLGGVFAVTVNGAGLVNHPAVANMGCRPTVAGRNWRLEVHLLDFAGDLYGRHIEVSLRHFLRPEQKFDGLEALRTAIHGDIAQARQWFAARAETDHVDE